MKRWNVAITGFGAVGQAVAELLSARRERYASIYDADVRLTGVRRSRTGLIDLAGLSPSAWRETPWPDWPTGVDILEAAHAHVLIEAGPSDFRTGGAAHGYIGAALAQGRHVIAISKGALVHDGPGLRALARRHGVALKISGATAAALPTIDLLRYSLAGCEILAVEGILNATTNFLLTAMMDRDVGLAQALAEAQQAGVAEPDPSFDIEGWDTACKVLILANFGLNAALKLDEMEVTGIQDIGEPDIRGWRAEGLTPKLVGYIRREGSSVRAGVHLKTFPPSDVFALVRGKAKAIRITTDVMGEVVATVNGAEPRATAAAALKDFEHLLSGGV